MAPAPVCRRRRDPGRVGATDRMYPPYAKLAAPYVSSELSQPARHVPPVQYGSTSVLDSADLRRAETENLIFTSAAASAGTPDDATAVLRSSTSLASVQAVADAAAAFLGSIGPDGPSADVPAKLTGTDAAQRAPPQAAPRERRTIAPGAPATTTRAPPDKLPERQSVQRPRFAPNRLSAAAAARLEHHHPHLAALPGASRTQHAPPAPDPAPPAPGPRVTPQSATRPLTGHGAPFPPERRSADGVLPATHPPLCEAPAQEPPAQEPHLLTTCSPGAPATRARAPPDKLPERQTVQICGSAANRQSAAAAARLEQHHPSGAALPGASRTQHAPPAPDPAPPAPGPCVPPQSATRPLTDYGAVFPPDRQSAPEWPAAHPPQCAAPAQEPNLHITCSPGAPSTRARAPPDKVTAAHRCSTWLPYGAVFPPFLPAAATQRAH